MPPRERFQSIEGDELYRRLAMGQSVAVLDVRTDFEAALALGDRARTQILEHCSEPDLSLKKMQF